MDEHLSSNPSSSIFRNHILVEIRINCAFAVNFRKEEQDKAIILLHSSNTNMVVWGKLSN